MTVLLFDAGNTRFKWALVRDGHLGPQQAVPVGALQDFARALARAPELTRVVGVSVAGRPLERDLRARLRDAQCPAPQFITGTDQAAGVRSAYRDPSRLGADRWAAAVAAWHRAGCYRTVCAVSIGTAITMDVVDQDGHHRGGLIAPGPDTMLRSLLGGTRQIAARAALDARLPRRRRDPALHPLVPPLTDNTQAAIEHGCFAAAAGLIDRTINQVTRRLGVRPVVFLTGGGSDAVEPLLRSAVKPCPDLVLRGVAVLAEVRIRRRA